MALYGCLFNLRRWGCLSKTFCQLLLSIKKQIITSKMSNISKIITTSGKSLSTLRNGTTKLVASATTTKKASHRWSRSITMTTIMKGSPSPFTVLKPQNISAKSLLTGKTSQLTGISTITSKSKNGSLQKKGTMTLMGSKSANLKSQRWLITTKETSPLTLTTI